MFEGIIDIDITAPEFDRHMQRVEKGFNGTLMTLDEDIELFEKVERILGRLPICGEDNMRAFRFPLPIGSFEDFLRDEYDGEEIDDEELEDARCFFDCHYLDGYKWYTLMYTCTEMYGRYLSVDGRCMFIAENREDSKTYWDHGCILSDLIAICGKMADHIRDGTYAEAVRENIPYRYRWGVVRRKDLWESGYFTRESDLDGLTEEEIGLFGKMVEEGCSKEPEGRIPEMTVNRYLELCSICFEARGCDLNGKGLEARYRRYADGRDSGMLDLDPDDPVAFAEFLKGSHDGHVWEVRPGHGFSCMHLYPHHDENGYFLSLNGPFDRAAFIRSAIGLRKEGLPLMVYDGEKTLKAVLGEDWIGVVPEGSSPHYQSSRFKEYDVMECIGYTDELMEKVGDGIVWYPVRTFYD